MNGSSSSSRIADLEAIIQEDPGERGIKHLHIPGELLAAAEDLVRSKAVAIITGFYIWSCQNGETDGPPGALAIAKALVSLGKAVSLVTDEANAPLLQAALNASSVKDRVGPIITFPTITSNGGLYRDTELASELLLKFDHIVAIERVGPAEDGKYHNMRGEDITAYCGRADLLVSLANKLTAHQVRTTGIGDGGNEVGMGKVKEKVEQHILHGHAIACAVKADNLITSGVSNWGGYALAAALFCLHPESSNILPNIEEESAILDAMVAVGGVDGCLRKSERSVDGLPFERHAEKLKQLVAIVERGLEN